FSLLGTTYGGNGQTTFALPNLQGRVSVGSGQPFLGENGGEQAHTLTEAELPAHGHGAQAASSASETSPAGKLWGGDGSNNVTFATTANVVLASGAIASTGGSQP